MSSSVSDLEDHPAPLAGSAGPHDGTESARDPSLAADHLADVLLRNVQAKYDGVVSLLFLDADGVGVVDQPLGQVRQELSQGS